MSPTTIRPVYLAPHLDDAALSCGGLIHQQVMAGMQPLVITCCAGVPAGQSFSPFAEEQHRRWGLPNDAVSRRRREDAAAMAHLGAAYEHWDYMDCIYRCDPRTGEYPYASEEALFGSVHRMDSALVRELIVRLTSALTPMDSLIYAPLAVGNHVDHQIVLRAALCLHAQGFQVHLYEDYPYADDRQKLSCALRPWEAPPAASVHAMALADIDAKIGAVRLYRSQLDVLFGGEAKLAMHMRAYAARLGAECGLGERYWSGGQRRWDAWPMSGLEES